MSQCEELLPQGNVGGPPLVRGDVNVEPSHGLVLVDDLVNIFAGRPLFDAQSPAGKMYVHFRPAEWARGIRFVMLYGGQGAVS